MKTAPPNTARRVVPRLHHWVLPALSALLLAACGGGGGSSGSTGDSTGTTVVVESAPVAVTELSATASDSTIVLSFKVSNPQNVTAFEAVCSGNGQSVTTRSASNGTATDTVTVTGLTNAQSYNCSVSAINSSGTSTASSPVQATAGSSTTATASSPGVLSMEGAPTSVLISFSESSLDGGAAVSSYVGICVGPDKVSYSYAAASPITVVGVTAGLPYTCWVSGLNAQGAGKASAASVVTPQAAAAAAADAPAAPGGVSVTRGSGSATVAFTTTSASTSATKRRAQGVATGSGTLFRATCGKGDSVVSVESTSSPISVPQLTNGAGYSCSVTATTTAGTSADSAAVPVTPSTVPDAPTLSAATAGDTTATLSFTAPASNGGAAIDSYHATCTTDSQTAAADASTAGSVVVAGLVNGSTYSCSLAAVNAAGTGAASGMLSVTPVASTTTPTGSVASAPQTVQATTGNGNAVISFAAVTGSASPVLDYTATCTSGSQQVSATGTTSPITVSGLTNGSNYSCSVTARTEAGSSQASDAQTVTPAVTAPAAPTLVSVTPGDSAISVAFTAGSDGGSAVTAFTATCGDKTGSGSASPVTVAGLTNGQIYACSVAATNAVGTSASSDKRDTKPRTVPQKPTQVTATPGDTTIAVGYVAPSDNGGADILGYTASCKNGSSTLAATSSASTDTSITVHGLTDGTIYTCTVTANNTAGSSEASDSVSATPSATVAETAPDAATNLSMTIGDSTLTVTFDPPASNGADVSYALICSPGDINKTAVNGSVTATGVQNGTSYSCLIRATRGTKSTDAVLSAAGIPNVKPAAPNLSVAAGNQQLAYSFTPASGVTYAASCYTGDISAGSFSVTGLTNGTSYSCTVTATNSAGPASTEVTATPSWVPGAPSLALTAGSASAGNASLTITVTPPTDNGGATITDYALSCNSNIGFTPTPTKLSTTLTGLPNNTSYGCSVKAKNSNGWSVSSSDASATTGTSIPGAPSLTLEAGTASSGNASLAITVTPPINNGGATITDYALTCNNTVSFAPTPTNLSTAITGLPNNTSYTCSIKAKNSNGWSVSSSNASATTGISVPGTPKLAMTSGTATDGSASIQFSVSAPSNNGGSTITGYAVTCSPAVTVSITPSNLSATVSGLSNNTSYSCTVKATNAIGTGLASTSAVATTLPATPTLSVTSGDGQLTYSFTPVTGLSYTASCVNNYGSTISGGSFSVTNLVNGQNYDCTLKATNSGGSRSSASVTGTPYGKPSTPASSLAPSCDTLSNYYATATFTAPSNTGGGTLTYSGTLNGTDAATSTSVGNTSYSQTKSASNAGSMRFQITISGNYTFTVTATNNGNLSATSTPSTIYVSTFPDCRGGAGF